MKRAKLIAGVFGVAATAAIGLNATSGTQAADTGVKDPGTSTSSVEMAYEPTPSGSGGGGGRGALPYNPRVLRTIVLGG